MMSSTEASRKVEQIDRETMLPSMEGLMEASQIVTAKIKISEVEIKRMRDGLEKMEIALSGEKKELAIIDAEIRTRPLIDMMLVVLRKIMTRNDKSYRNAHSKDPNYVRLVKNGYIRRCEAFLKSRGRILPQNTSDYDSITDFGIIVDTMTGSEYKEFQTESHLTDSLQNANSFLAYAEKILIAAHEEHNRDLAIKALNYDCLKIQGIPDRDLAIDFLKKCNLEIKDVHIHLTMSKNTPCPSCREEGLMYGKYVSNCPDDGVRKCIVKAHTNNGIDHFTTGCCRKTQFVLLRGPEIETSMSLDAVKPRTKMVQTEERFELKKSASDSDSDSDSVVSV
jgi:hypothetical protein